MCVSVFDLLRCLNAHYVFNLFRGVTSKNDLSADILPGTTEDGRRRQAHGFDPGETHQDMMTRCNQSVAFSVSLQVFDQKTIYILPRTELSWW